MAHSGTLKTNKDHGTQCDYGWIFQDHEAEQPPLFVHIKQCNGAATLREGDEVRRVLDVLPGSRTPGLAVPSRRSDFVLVRSYYESNCITIVDYSSCDLNRPKTRFAILKISEDGKPVSRRQPQRRRMPTRMRRCSSTSRSTRPAHGALRVLGNVILKHS